MSNSQNLRLPYSVRRAEIEETLFPVEIKDDGDYLQKLDGINENINVLAERFDVSLDMPGSESKKLCTDIMVLAKIHSESSDNYIKYLSIHTAIRAVCIAAKLYRSSAGTEDYDELGGFAQQLFDDFQQMLSKASGELTDITNTAHRTNLFCNLAIAKFIACDHLKESRFGSAILEFQFVEDCKKLAKQDPNEFLRMLSAVAEYQSHDSSQRLLKYIFQKFSMIEDTAQDVITHTADMIKFNALALNHVPLFHDLARRNLNYGLTRLAAYYDKNQEAQKVYDEFLTSCDEMCVHDEIKGMARLALDFRANRPLLLARPLVPEIVLHNHLH